MIIIKNYTDSRSQKIKFKRQRRYPPEVDVEQDSLGQQHEVVQVPVSHPKQIRHHAAPGAAAGEVVEGLALHAQGAGGVCVVMPQEL